ncbi:basal body-orientation factor 1 [Clupea harengus]|uniref:Basal body-orientation factor 1 n=1 Tax=Clupea harengus TaxID=7950 RepID=A0A6P8H1Z7_CLUHA|nr:basal body-orientation factor 1 [Clupea harengus]
MPPKKTERKPDVELPTPPESDKDSVLQKEYGILTNTLLNLKRKLEQLRKENEFLQNEANQTRMESHEYMAYVSKRTQKRQKAIVTLSDQNHQQLESLSEQREKLLEKYEEQASELKQKILEKENELALLNIEIADLREFKSLQQQQLSRIAELEKEGLAMRCCHSESLQALKSDFLTKKECHQNQAQQEVNNLALAANREASECLLSHTQEVAQENECLRTELQQLIQRAHVLRTHQDRLQAQRRQLLMEKEYVQELRRLRAVPHSHSRPQGGSNAVQPPPQQDAEPGTQERGTSEA